MNDQPANVIRVYLVDDHELVRRGLRQLLDIEPDIEVVGESATATEALRRLPALRPHVAVVDNRLGDGTGVEVCRSVRQRFPEVSVIILTSFDDEEAIFQAIMAGASAFLLKQIRGNELVDAIRRVAAGQSLLDPGVTAQVLDRLRHGPAKDPMLDSLTPQERRILVLIGKGWTNRQIADEVSLAEKTVKNYVSSILAKLGLERRTQAAVYAVQHLGD